MFTLLYALVFLPEFNVNQKCGSQNRNQDIDIETESLGSLITAPCNWCLVATWSTDTNSNARGHMFVAVAAILTAFTALGLLLRLASFNARE